MSEIAGPNLPEPKPSWSGEPGTIGSRAANPGPPVRSPRRLVVVTAASFVAAVVFAITAYWPAVSPIAPASARRLAARTEVRKAARRFVEDLTTFDYRTLDVDFRRVLRDSTGSFAKGFGKAYGSESLRREFVKRRARSTGHVLAMSDPSLKDDTATLYVFADQTTRNLSRPRPATRAHVFRLTLERMSRRWLIAVVDDVAPGAQS